MRHIILCLGFLITSINGFSQDLDLEKKYDFAELFEQIQNDAPIFIVALFKVDKNLTLLGYKSQIIFPLVEEKEMMNFSKGNRQKGFTPNILFDNVYQKPPSFTIHSSYKQQTQGGQLKILKGYDYCLRPIY